MNPKSIFSKVAVLLTAFTFLTACSGGTVTPTPTSVVGVVNGAVALIQQDMYLRLTQQVIEDERIKAGAQMTATQQVMDATATQSRHEENIKSTQKADYSTQQAFQITVAAGKAQDTATAQAQAAATAQAYQHATSTAEAQATATQMAVLGVTATFEAKSTEISDKKTQEAPIIAAKLKGIEIDTQNAELEFKKKQDTYWLSAFGGWVFGIIALVIGIFVVWKKSQIGVIADENGKVRIVMINQRALQPALMHEPVIDFSNGQVNVPPMGTPPEMQHQLVHERNIVDAIAELPQGYQRQAVGMTAGMTAPQSAVNIQVVQPGNVQSWLDDVQGQISSRAEEDG